QDLPPILTDRLTPSATLNPHREPEAAFDLRNINRRQAERVQVSRIFPRKRILLTVSLQTPGLWTTLPSPTKREYYPAEPLQTILLTVPSHCQSCTATTHTCRPPR
ncbi:hypothetical protein LTS18_011617, partial [Coniosporium uncinatum]